MLIALERLGRAMRRLGLGRVVDGVGVMLGDVVARRQCVLVDGFEVRGSQVGHLWYLREVASGRESFLTEIAARAAVPGGLAVDGGAQLGLVSLAMARRGASVIAFEPNPSVRRALERNIERNGLAASVSVRASALGSSRGRGYLSDEGDESTLARGRGTPVDVVALDDVLSGEVPAVVKLDLEGWEVEALRGMSSTLAAGVVVLVECNPQALDLAGSSAGELVRTLQDSGYEVRLVDERTRRLEPLASPPPEGYVNLLAARPATVGGLLRVLDQS